MRVPHSLRNSPFFPRTAVLMQGQNWRRWAGYAAASCYEFTHDREYAAVRNAAALFDVTPLHKYRISGPDATRLLDRIVTRNVPKTQQGQVIYMSWCDARGKVIDDGTLTRLGEQCWRMTSAEPNLRWLRRNTYGMDVQLEEVSEQLGALALQGPLSRAVLNAVARDAVDGLKYFRMMDNRIAGVEIQISRTGYTGDLGYELWIPAEGALAVWDALTAAGADYGLMPAGIWALDVARIEAGLVMLDVDYHSAHRAMIEAQLSTPFELSLDWSVTLDKAPFNGRRALLAEKARGPAWRFVGIEVDWNSFERLWAGVNLTPALPMIAWRASVPLYRENRQVGYASSGVWSPLLKKYLALAHVSAPHFAPDTPLEMEMTVEHRRLRVNAWVRKLPFFDPPRKKA
ncbi:MAG: aminomethyltransferase family protein [Gammaproteobacteria bacterium]